MVKTDDRDNSITTAKRFPGRPRRCPLPNKMFSIRLPTHLIERLNELKRDGQIRSLTDFVIEALVTAVSLADHARQRDSHNPRQPRRDRERGGTGGRGAEEVSE